MRLEAAAACVVAFSLVAGPAYACKKERHEGEHARHARKVERISWQQVLLRDVDVSDLAREVERPSRTGVSLDAYEGIAAWVDLFDEGPWTEPKRMIKRLARRDVVALFLQTSSYGQPRDIMHERTVGLILDAAHRNDIQVISWYVPSFAKMKVDRRRSLKALRFRSPSGDRFDSFALDIEATHVDNIATRNRRLLNLATDLRAAAPANYPLGAITPDPKAALYWPGFPWKKVAQRFDVVVPMGYWSFFADGYKEVHRYTEQGIRMIRKSSDDPDVPVHYIGGIANEASEKEVKGFVRAAKQKNAIGASLYDAPITPPSGWRALRTFSHPEPPAPPPPPPTPIGDDVAELRRVPPAISEVVVPQPKPELQPEPKPSQRKAKSRGKAERDSKAAASKRNGEGGRAPAESGRNDRRAGGARHERPRAKGSEGRKRTDGDGSGERRKRAGKEAARDLNRERSEDRRRPLL